jgi:hypothetical protein
VAQQLNVAVGGWIKELVAHLFAAQPRISGEWPEIVRDAEADMIAFLEHDQRSAVTAARRWKTGNPRTSRILLGKHGNVIDLTDVIHLDYGRWFSRER